MTGTRLDETLTSSDIESSEEQLHAVTVEVWGRMAPAL